MEQRDVVIIGGGPAGYVGAIRAAQLGGKVTLIETGGLGGTCLNRGCIPTRALTRGVEFLDLGKKSKDYGVVFGAPEVDFAKMVARKDMVVKTIVGGVQLLMQANGIEVVSGRGRFLSPTEVEAQVEAGGTQQFKAGKVVIATGCRWEMPAVPGADAVITTEQALNLKEVPASLLILGGGDVAFAFATIFAKLGAAVTVAAAGRRSCPGSTGNWSACSSGSCARTRSRSSRRPS
jgi:dihydrolipoamide dehydrogenase